MNMRAITTDALLTPQAALVALGGFLLYFSCWIVYQRLFSPLAKFPGPFWASITDFWRMHLVFWGEQHTALIELHRRHGHVVRIGPNELSITEPAAFRKIYSHTKVFPKAEYYDVFKNGAEFSIFSERDEKIHGLQRRHVAKPYAKSSLMSMDGELDTVVTTMVEKLRSSQGKPIDLSKWLELFAFDYVCDLSFNKNYGYIEAGTDHGLFRSSIRELTKFATGLGQVPQIFHLLQPIFWVLESLTGSLDAAEQKVRAITEEAVNSRKSRMASGDLFNKDIVATILANPPKEGISDKEIKAAMGANVVAGVGDVAILLNAVFYLLLKHPDKLQKLREELDQKRAEGKLSRVVRASEAESCPYLQACFNEAARLHPPAPGLLQRLVPEGGLEVGGQFVPKGVTVGTAAWTIHRLPEIWGEDVDAFRPERWLDEERKVEMNRYFFAFGGGTRVCLGRNLTYMEMGKLVPTLLSEFDFEVLGDWKVTCQGSVHQDDFNVIVKERS